MRSGIAMNGMLSCPNIWCSMDVALAGVIWLDEKKTHWFEFGVGMNHLAVNLILKVLEFDVIPDGLLDTNPCILFYPNHIDCVMK